MLMEVFMRSISFVALVLALVLAGCGGQAPSPTAVPPTAAPATDVPVVSQDDNQLATLAATVGAAQPGTLVIPNDSKTPNAPTPAPIVLDSLLFTQTGGIANISLSIELHGDGTLIRDGQTSKVSADDVKQIQSLLDGIHFFTLQGIFVSPASAADAYTYTLSVNSPTGSRTISSQDGMT